MDVAWSGTSRLHFIILLYSQRHINIYCWKKILILILKKNADISSASGILLGGAVGFNTGQFPAPTHMVIGRWERVSCYLIAFSTVVKNDVFKILIFRTVALQYKPFGTLCLQSPCKYHEE